MSPALKVGTRVRLRPTKPHGRDGGEVVVTNVREDGSIDYTDPRNGGSRTVRPERIARVCRTRNCTNCRRARATVGSLCLSCEAA